MNEDLKNILSRVDHTLLSQTATCLLYTSDAADDN